MAFKGAISYALYWSEAAILPGSLEQGERIRSRRLRSQRRDRIILADNCSEVKKAEQAHAEN